MEPNSRLQVQKLETEVLTIGPDDSTTFGHLPDPRVRQIEAAALALQLRERRDTDQRIASAQREYEWRVANNQPYEDLVDADELRARYGT